LYSHIPDFCWLDQAEKYRTDWEGFSRELVLSSVKPEPPDAGRQGGTAARRRKRAKLQPRR
jgi:hypothetical protein